MRTNDAHAARSHVVQHIIHPMNILKMALHNLWFLPFSAPFAVSSLCTPRQDLQRYKDSQATALLYLHCRLKEAGTCPLRKPTAPGYFSHLKTREAPLQIRHILVESKQVLKYRDAPPFVLEPCWDCSYTCFKWLSEAIMAGLCLAVYHMVLKMARSVTKKQVGSRLTYLCSP
jgi:hypothetical protein